MKELSNWMNQIHDAWRETISAIISHLPSVLGGLLLVVVGWLLAKIARLIIIRLVRFMERGLQNLSDATSLSRINFPPRFTRIAGDAVYWLVILVFLTAAARSLELHAFSIWLARILNYVPVLLAGGLIIIAGYIASLVVRDVVTTSLTSGGFQQGPLVGSLAQGSVLLTAVVVGVDQMGVDVTFLVTIIAVALGCIFGGFALAFGFGSRDFVSNLIAANDLRKHYELGQHIRIGEAEGEIVELTPTSIVLAAHGGRVTLPAQIFHQSETRLLITEEVDE